MARIVQLDAQTSAGAEERLRAERILSRARAILAFSALIALALDPTRSTSTLNLAFTLLAGYSIFACVAVAVLWYRSASWPLSPIAEHAIDVSLAIAVTLLTEGSSSPLFVLFLFTLLAAAYHWGYRETVGTAVIGVLCLGLQAELQLHSWLAPGTFELNRLIMRSMYLLMAGVLTGYLARAEKQARREALSIAAIMSKADVRIGLKETLAEIFQALLTLFDARRVVLVVREPAAKVPFVWQADRAPEGDRRPLRVSPLDASDLDRYLFASETDAWHAVARTDRRGASRLDVVGLDDRSVPLPRQSVGFPDALREAIGPFDQVLALDIRGEVTGRLFLIDVHLSAGRHAALRFGQRLIRLIGPAVYNVYLLGRLRSRAAADERARVSRELHDGIVQAIIGVQIQLHALSMRSAEQSPELAGEVARIDMVLRQESLKLRELMQQMKPIDVGPDDLIDTIAGLVGRFQRETGITARFICKLDRVAMPPWACQEITRIVQEALVNVRKHSGARNVFVRFGRSVNDGCLLSIADDGRGLGFVGRRAHAERRGEHGGPGVISERVRLLGADLVLDSDPSRGTHLEIAVPRLRHGIQG